MKPIAPLSPLNSPAAAAATGPRQPAAGGFGKMLGDAIAQVNQNQLQADQAVEKLQTGEARNIHEVMIALEKADISMRLMVQMRNKVIEAYQEVMRMQV
jgi:flagellar hook-basal body complex protein FliE